MLCLDVPARRSPRGRRRRRWSPTPVSNSRIRHCTKEFVRESSLFEVVCFLALPGIFQPLAGDISVEELEGRLQVGGADVGLVDLSVDKITLPK